MGNLQEETEFGQGLGKEVEKTRNWKLVGDRLCNLCHIDMEQPHPVLSELLRAGLFQNTAG